MNDLTIHTAVAARLMAATPPTGYALRAAHATPPDNLATVPAAVCIPGGDTITYGTGGSRTTVLTVNVIVYTQDQADMARKYADLLTWRTWLRGVFDGQVQLNTAGVAQAIVSSTTIGTDTWADSTYLTITAELQVSILEGVNVTA
jgi:hypothetical protein